MPLYVVDKVIVAPPSSTAKYPVFRTPSLRNYCVKRILLHFPTGVNYTLNVKFFIGEEQVLPNEGYFTGDDCVLPIDVELVVTGGSVLYAEVTNTDSSYDHRVQIIVMGELESIQR